MPSGAYIRTKEMRKNMSKAKIGYRATKETCKILSVAHIGQIPWNKNKPEFKISKKKLYKLYIKQDNSKFEIAKIIGCSYLTVHRRIKKYNIFKIKEKVIYKCFDCGKIVGEENRRCASCALKSKWNNQQYRERMKNIHKKRCEDPQVLKAMSRVMKKAYRNHPTFKRRIRKSLLGRFGKFARNWQGGLSFEPYSIKFNGKLKRKIRERDNNICQLCSKRKYKEELTVHHIDYNKKNCKKDNLIALCRSCNVKVSYNRDYWFAYFKFLMEKKNGKTSYHN